MAGSYWRDMAREKIKQVIAEVGLEDPGRLKRALFDAYPFGTRNYHPYKIWLSEIKKQVPDTGSGKKADQLELFR